MSIANEYYLRKLLARDVDLEGLAQTEKWKEKSMVHLRIEESE
jgi:hypothetical protein